MHLRPILCGLTAAILTTACAMAQQQYPPAGNYPQPNNYPPPADRNVQPGQPYQPLQPQVPTLERRNGQPGPQSSRLPPAPPFTLTQQQQAQVDRVLSLWEQRNRDVKTFDAGFRRWVYDTVFGRKDEPKFIDLGVIKYAAPDRGMFRVDTTTAKDGREVPIEDARHEHWISDGKSIIEYNHVKKQMIVHKLPPERQGKAIADGPLPFLFGSTADMLKRRYFIRIVTPAGVPGQVWLQAYPRFQQDAANFHHAHFIITDKMEPYALEMIQPNEKDKIVYRFYDIVINDPLRMFRGDPFRAAKPLGWLSIVEESASAQARSFPNDSRR